MSADERLEAFLNNIKAENRSSPYAWHDFYIYLKGCKTSDMDVDPIVPLILAASGASDADKHRRLGAQLQWAKDRGKLDQAIDWLEALPIADWNYCSPDKWQKSSYF
jgi:hypothetical protein